MTPLRPLGGAGMEFRQLGAEGAAALRKGGAVPGEGEAPKPKNVDEAASQFEAILIRQMLKSLEKTTQVGSKSAVGGSQVFGGMVVDAMADAIVKSGGMGLAKLMSSELAPPSGAQELKELKQDPRVTKK